MANWRFYLDGNEVEEPIGWDAIEFTAIRMESSGIDQPFSTEVRFYERGAKYIKQIYDQYFINQPIAITITSDVGVNGQPYEFQGFLNLAIYSEHNVCDTDSWEITVGIIDDIFREQFKARQDVEVDLTTLTDLNGDAIDPVTWKNVRMHKQDLYLTATGRNTAEQYSFLKYIPQGFSPYDWTYPDYVNVVPIFWGNSDFKDIFGSTKNTIGSAFTNTNVMFVNNTNYTRWFDLNIRITGEFTWYNTPQWYFDGETANIDFVVRTFDENGLNDAFYLVGSTDLNTASISSPTATQFDLSANINLGLLPNYRILLLMYWGLDGSIKREVPIAASDYGDYERWLYPNIESSCVKMSEKNSGTYASFANGLTIEQYFKRLIYIMTGSNDKLISDAFSEADSGCYWNNMLTNGLKIRNALTITQAENGCIDADPEDQTVLKTSFKKTFDGLDSIFCLGWAFEWTGTEWKIRIEPREYFYQNSLSNTFTNVGEVTQMAKVDKLVNNIILGYSDNWKNIAISGAWAIHTDRNYFVDNKAMNEGSSANLDIRSEIIAEGYAIEFSRRLSFIEYDSGSSDRPNDYNIFLIWLNRNEFSVENIEDTPFYYFAEAGAYTFSPGTVSMPSNYITASNSPLNGLYNIFHTPARIAGRWWKILGMHTYGLTNPVMRYQVGQYQTTYSSAISSSNEPCIQFTSDDVVAENTNISAAILDADNNYVLFKPIAVEFSYPQSLCDFLILSQDEQYRKVRLTSGSLDIQGFIQEATNQPEDASGGTTKFTLIVANQLASTGSAFTDGYDDGYENGN